MANNYQDVVGQIHVKKMTPVIEALFKGHNLNPLSMYPGNGVYGIWSGEMFSSAEPYWGSLAEALEELWAKLQISAIEVEFSENGTYYGHLLRGLFTHFNTIDKHEAKGLIGLAEKSDDYDIVELRQLFDMAQLMDDGHGLYLYQADSAWYCSKPRFQEFGGYGEYHSHKVHLNIDSSSADYYGPRLDKALTEQDYPAAGVLMVNQVKGMLAAITDWDERDRVKTATMQELHRIYGHHDRDLPTSQPASNESQTNPYDNIPILTAQEQREEIAEMMYGVADEWAKRTNITARDKVFGAVREVVGVLEYGDATIPPFQMTPVNPSGQTYIAESLQRIEPDKFEYAPASWNFNTPLPIATAEENIIGLFDDLVEAYDQRRYNAAKKMFGT